MTPWVLTRSSLKMDGPADLDDVDREALERAMKIAQRDPLRAEHLRSKLEDQPWREVAEFAAYSCQIDALSLKPWQDPPVIIDEDADEPNNSADRAPNTAARKLLRQMLRAGVSRYEPDPLTALRQAARKRRRQPDGKFNASRS
jgi:hypothetical protein